MTTIKNITHYWRGLPTGPAAGLSYVGLIFTVSSGCIQLYGAYWPIPSYMELISYPLEVIAGGLAIVAGLLCLVC